MKTAFYDDFFEKGFKKFSEPDALSLIRIEEFKLLNVEERTRDNGINDLSSTLNQRLSAFSVYLKNKYIDPVWEKSKFNKYLVWDGVDRDNQGWHTDLFEGYDLFFLYYFDDTSPQTGGSINFKWNRNETQQFYPEAGDLFLVSNTRGFWHRAESTTVTRRVASFDFTTAE